MATYNFADFYIEYPGHPRFNDTQIIEDDVIRVIIQKWEISTQENMAGRYDPKSKIRCIL